MSNNDDEYFRYLYEDTLNHISLLVPGADELSETADARLFEAFERKFCVNQEDSPAKEEDVTSTQVPISITSEITLKENNQTIVEKDPSDLISLTFLSGSPKKIFPTGNQSTKLKSSDVSTDCSSLQKLKNDINEISESFSKLLECSVKMFTFTENLQARLSNKVSESQTLYKSKYDCLEKTYKNREALYLRMINEKDQIINNK